METKLKAVEKKSEKSKKSCGCQGKCTCEPKPKTRKSCTRKSTVAVMKCDIGFGNTLFIRGEGAKNLSWDKGLALTFDEKEQAWCFRASGNRPIEFKVLINDSKWSEGENFVLSPGGKQTFEPIFLYD
jgi:hypothetical protein